MSKLYPIKFKPILKEKIWGGARLKNILDKTEATQSTGESWEISGLPGSVSVISNGFLAGNELPEIIEIYMGDLVGEHVFEKYGTEFPLLLKFIDANNILSVQVHPDDEMAKQLHKTNGKNEIWYIIDSSHEAYIYTGFSKLLTKNKFQEHIRQNTVKEVLNCEKAQKGDVFYMPAGRIHATGPGVLFAEIQQSSDITYRVYDWGRVDQQGNQRQLHVDEALQALDFTVENDYRSHYNEKPNKQNVIKETPNFVLNKLKINRPLDIDYNTTDSFIVYMCISGSAKVQYFDYYAEPIKKGETLLIPSVLETVKVIPNDEVELLEVYIPADQ